MFLKPVCWQVFCAVVFILSLHVFTGSLQHDAEIRTLCGSDHLLQDSLSLSLALYVCARCPSAGWILEPLDISLLVLVMDENHSVLLSIHKTDSSHWIPNSVPRVAAANLHRASVMFHCNQITPDPQSEQRSVCLDLHIMALIQYILLELMNQHFFFSSYLMWRCDNERGEPNMLWLWAQKLHPHFVQTFCLWRTANKNKAGIKRS